MNPLDQLAERYGRRKPCPYGKGREPLGMPHFEDCTGGCHGTGTVLDMNNVLFKALWEFQGDIDTGLGPFIPRSRIEVALLLPDVTGGFQHFTYWKSGRVTCELFSDEGEPIGEGHANNWLDALSAAILENEGVAC